MNSEEFTLKYLLDQRRPTLQFHLLKYLKYEDIVKLSLISKNAGSLCDANKVSINCDNFDKSDKIEI
jgi:hypothetical protein